MFKTTLMFAVVASAYLITADAKAQVEYTDPISPAQACVDGMPLCISLPAQTTAKPAFVRTSNRPAMH